MNKSKTAPTVKVQNDPPTIFVSYTPAILLQIDGEPTRADIADTDLGFIVNSNFPLFFETDAAKDYYLYTGDPVAEVGFNGRPVDCRSEVARRISPKSPTIRSGRK